MRRLAAAALLAALACVGAGQANAEIDWPITLRLPDRDFSIGASGGIAFGEARALHGVGGAGALEVGFHHGLLGLHAGVRVHREGYSYRVSGGVEVTLWYLVQIGIGAQVGGMVGEGGPGIPELATAMTFLVAVPVPIAKLGEGKGGALLVVPYARPGMRFEGAGQVSGFHEAGLMLQWTSFGF